MRKEDEEMKIPDGKTCADCLRFAGCKRFFGAHDITKWTSCDWWPSKFVGIPENKIATSNAA